MADGDRPQDRSALLAFVERHWRDLTLHDASSLCADIVEAKSPISATVKASLTYR